MIRIKLYVFILLFLGSSLTMFAETFTLQDTLTVFDGQMYGATGCDSEFPLRNCQFINMGGLDYFNVGKNAAHVSTVYRSLMGFNFSGLSNHQSIEIDSAILTLVCIVVARADSVLNLGIQALRHGVYEGYTASYIEMDDSSFTWKASLFAVGIDTILWQTAGVKGDNDRDPTYYTASTPITTTGTYRIDVTDLVGHWFDSSATERWCVLGDTVALAGGKAYAKKAFWSSEGDVPPKLEIFYPALPDVRHSLDGAGVRHSPDGVSVRHGT